MYIVQCSVISESCDCTGCTACLQDGCPFKYIMGDQPKKAKPPGNAPDAVPKDKVGGDGRGRQRQEGSVMSLSTIKSFLLLTSLYIYLSIVYRIIGFKFELKTIWDSDHPIDFNNAFSGIIRNFNSLFCAYM